MESICPSYKQDNFGNDILARVIWSTTTSEFPKPIALIYHAGGLVLGSSEIAPQPQIDYLCSAGFLVVIPNYRLVPQVTAKEAFQDCEEAFDWTINTLPGLLDFDVDTTRIVAMGHSSGGTVTLHLASIKKPIKAALALYPFLFIAGNDNLSTSKSASSAEASMPTQQDWQEIAPLFHQISDAPLSSIKAPFSSLSPREKWVIQLFKAGMWLDTLQPDGDFSAIDPMTRLHADWSPVRIIHGSEDNAPGRSADLMRRAGEELRKAGVEDVEVDIVGGAPHMFDHIPEMGIRDLEERWQAVKRGLDWLIERA